MKDGILREGLTKGGYPLDSCGQFIRGVQWLTLESDPEKQSWATHILIPYSRTAFRLTVNIPDSFKKKLLKASDYSAKLPEEVDRKIVSDWPGSDAWYVYLGKIPPKWIVGCREMKEICHGH